MAPRFLTILTGRNLPKIGHQVANSPCNLSVFTACPATMSAI